MTQLTPLKPLLVAHCRQFAKGRIDFLRQEIGASQDSANQETKSSAGDKHETGRAMAQLETEMLSKRLDEALRMEQVAQSLSERETRETVVTGSVVTTTRGMFYIGISIGTVRLDGHEVHIVSAESPLAKAMLGRRSGDSCSWNGSVFSILDVA